MPNIELTEDQIFWKEVAENLKDVYMKLSKQELAEFQMDGRVYNFINRAELLDEITSAEIKAGIKKRAKKILIKL